MSETAPQIGLIASVTLELKAELGRCCMRVQELLNLGTGAIVTLDRSAGAPLDLTANGELIGRGDLVAVDDHYGIRITELLGDGTVGAQ